MPKKKKRPSNNPNGRPKKPPGEKFVTPNRILGRVNDTDWEDLKAAAKSEGLSFTAWALMILLRAARKKKKVAEDV